ncbi:MAG: hypothetical protein COT89_01000 [Candidatus Colwellbacteria bacterium CG10_big_fil_rev_8_21_14_0_10_42_22]|uniref:ComEC/Rec2-related protein domain-containing protein n=1 Tax=Candidatus Colwellbacteria bacterium CG10_big_fil_rev_8_21_14_0_10_42_22 TaxID=1974540 RepID=A0A2H0VGA8_9BACT|nr:MAG: hypothetical protein COT89_01000 [Candidatus Colwellbacteria bacterium CG10_big_fil_rev_8_21_14_0_10_42_22]
MHLHDKAFYISFFFILGVGFAGFDINVFISLTIGFILGYITFSLTLKQTLIFLSFLFSGFFYLHLYNALNQEIINFNTSDSYVGLVKNEPALGINSTEIQLNLVSPHKGEVTLYTSPLTDVKYGDEVQFSGIAEKSPSGNRNIVSFPDDSKVIEKGGGSVFKKNLFSIKNKLIANLKAVLPADKAALMSGILFGERAEFTKKLEEAMKGSGTTHIVALSGYNIAILSVTLAGALSYIWGRKKAFWMSLFVIPAFIVMTGADPSVVRAGIMGLVMLLATTLGRAYSFRNAITLTALGMLLYNPNFLIQDAGFQLSFSALMGIVYIYPWLSRKWDLSREGFLNWKTNALQTLSAQIAVLPIVLIVFGFFSPTAPIANILILEFIPVTMFVGFLSSVLGLFSHTLSLLVGWGVNLLLSYEIFIIDLFAFNWT